MSAPLVVVQARAGSTRLPGKVLADLGGRPMLELQLRRVRPAIDRTGATLVVATSDLPGDDAVAALADGLGVAVVRGSEADVLGRFALAHERHDGEPIVRLTGDCPLTDPGIVEAALQLHRAGGADYTSNVLPRSFPKGLDVEVLSPRALAAAHAEAAAGPDREHVTPFVYRRPERFRLANLHAGRDLGQEWWTVDTAEDLDRLRAIVGSIPDPVAAPWTEVLAAVGRAAAPGPGEIALVSRPGPEPGTSPWVRRWDVEVDGERRGEVAVSVGDGRTERTVSVPADRRDAVEAALDRLLAGDQQTRLDR